MWYCIITFLFTCTQGRNFISLWEDPSPPMLSWAPQWWAWPPQCWEEKGSNMKRNPIPSGFWWWVSWALFRLLPPPPHRFVIVTPVLVPYWASHADMLLFVHKLCGLYSMGVLYIVFTIHPVHVHSWSPTYMFILFAQLQEWIKKKSTVLFKTNLVIQRFAMDDYLCPKLCFIMVGQS